MKLSEILKAQAENLYTQSQEHVAVNMLKSAGMSEQQARLEVSQVLMEKEAVNALTATGIDYDQALALVKAADVKIKDLAEFKVELSFEEMLASQFEKAAELAQELEEKAEYSESLMTKVAELEEILGSTPQQVVVPKEITKLAESGTFTNEDLEALMKLPSETLTKVATSQEQPWSMGKGGNTAKPEMDPLLSFLLT